MIKKKNRAETDSDVSVFNTMLYSRSNNTNSHATYLSTFECIWIILLLLTMCFYQFCFSTEREEVESASLSANDECFDRLIKGN